MQNPQYVTADTINRRARLGVVLLLAFCAVLVGLAALGDDDRDPQVLGSAVDGSSVTMIPTPPSSTTTLLAAADDGPLAAGPGEGLVAVVEEPAATTTTTEAVVTTTTGPSTTVSPTTTTAPAATTTTTSPVATTSTTVPPTTTTTPVPPTTTTVPPTTTTTVPPTTTTSSTTTTTTLPDLPGLKLREFEGHDHGDEDEWEAHIKVEIRDEDDEKVRFATVLIQWSGGQTGEARLVTKKDGKIDERIGPFSAESLTFRIGGVFLDGYRYEPSLNQVADTISIEVD